MVNTNVLVKIFCCFIFVQFVKGQTVDGLWKTVDDETGETKAIVELYQKDGVLKGKIIKVLTEDKNPLCAKCKGDLKNKPVVGMEIISDFRRSGDEYKGRKLLDPETGMVVRGKIWLDPENTDKLKVRGYLAFLYRTQTWLRVN